MKVSEISTAVLKQYCGLSDDDDLVLDSCLVAAKQQAVSYTGLSEEELDKYEDITIAVLSMANDNYIYRFDQNRGRGLNPTAEFILSLHSINLI